MFIWGESEWMLQLLNMHAAEHSVACDRGGCWTAVRFNYCAWQFSRMNLTERLKRSVVETLVLTDSSLIKPVTKHRCISELARRRTRITLSAVDCSDFVSDINGGLFKYLSMEFLKEIKMICCILRPSCFSLQGKNATGFRPVNVVFRSFLKVQARVQLLEHSILR